MHTSHDHPNHSLQSPDRQNTIHPQKLNSASRPSGHLLGIRSVYTNCLPHGLKLDQQLQLQLTSHACECYKFASSTMTATLDTRPGFLGPRVSISHWGLQHGLCHKELSCCASEKAH